MKRNSRLPQARQPRPVQKFRRSLYEPLEQRLLLTILVVNNITDTAVTGQLSLRQAVAQAETDAAGGTSDTITFDPSLGGQTINLSQGDIELTSTGTATITIDGNTPSQPVTITESSASGALVIDSGATVVLANLDFSNCLAETANGGAILNAGTLTVNDTTFEHDQASSLFSSSVTGGAISSTGPLTLNSDTFTNNDIDSQGTPEGGAIYTSRVAAVINDCTFVTNNGATNGGAIASVGGGTLTLNNDSFSDNGANNFGNAVYSLSSTLEITGSLFSDNHGAAPTIENDGGIFTMTGSTLNGNLTAVENDGGTATISSSTFSYNGAYNGSVIGSAIDVTAGTVNVSSSTFFSNGNYNGGGGAIGLLGGTVSLTNSTLFQNFAYGPGGAIDNASGTVNLADDTLTQNHTGYPGGAVDNAGTLTVMNSIIAGNLGPSGSPDIGGSITTDGGYNLLGTVANNSTTIPTPGSGDVFNDNPDLSSSLSNYGGPTQTLAVLAGSPAIGAGNPSATGDPSTDQRGLARTVGGKQDIGAFQTQTPTLAFTTLGQTFTAGQTASITIQAEDPDGQPVVAGSGGISVTLSSTSTGGAFSDALGNPLAGSMITIPSGSSSVTFEYSDTAAGTPQLSASATDFVTVHQTDTILPAPITNTPSADIIVGRTLSDYYTGDVQNNQVTITFTVYNQSSTSISGVLLTDTLATGVTLVSASQQPDQSGQSLAWSLGTIEGDYWTSVSITVSLSSSSILQLDTGAQAYATLNALAISNVTPAATLTQGSVDDNLLASTADANTTDPYIQEEAAALDYNPQNIFVFLHNDITYNAYIGSVRGARGTLWSDAGNALDVASLGVALMRASGIPSQYEEGTLTTSQAQQLILSMFPASYQTVGSIVSGTMVSDPADDSTLQAETEDHFWFEFEAGGVMISADPLMPGTTIGQTVTAATTSFADVPSSMREETEVQLTAEIYNEAAAELGVSDGLSDTIDLDQTFDDVALVGSPLTLGFITSSSSAGFTYTSTTNTYTPYLALGDDAYDSTHDQIISGQEFDEVLSNFPLATEALTGLFLNVTESGPQGQSQTYSATLLDRIGYAARQGLVSAQITLPAGTAPAVSTLDAYTLDVTAAAPAPHPTAALNEELQTDAAEVASLQPTASDAQTTQTYGTDYDIDMTRILGNDFMSTSQLQTNALAATSDIVAYFARPRVVLVSQQFNASATTSETALTSSINMLNDSSFAEPAPGQATAATYLFNLTRGVFENINERNMVAALVPSGQIIAVDNTYDVFNAAIAQGIGFTDITAGNLSVLDALNIPADAKARITTDVQNGFGVIVPDQNVLLNGTPTIAWAEINFSTGEFIGVDEDGGHEGALELVALVGEGLELQLSVFKFLAPLAAYDAGAVLSVAYELNVEYADEQEAAATLKEAKEGVNNYYDALITVGETMANLLTLANPSEISFSHAYDNLLTTMEDQARDEYSEEAPELKSIFEQTLNATVEGLTGEDPALMPILSDPLPLTASPANQANGSADETSTSTAGSILGTVQDTSVSVSQQINAGWSSAATSAFQATAVNAPASTVVNASGQTVGVGAVALTTVAPVSVAISGNDQYTVNGTGSLAAYGSARTSLDISGDWDNYSATVTGSVSVTLTSDELTLNGAVLPAGTYTITTNSATLSGSGHTTSPNFSGSVAITASKGTVNLGPGSGSLTSGGSPVNLTNGAALNGYTGTIGITASGNSTDAITLSGNSTNVLSVSASPNAITTNETTPVTFATTINTSLADTYTLTAQAPAGWTVTIDNSGNVTVTPALGVQAGAYLIQITAQSSTDPNLVANAFVNITMTPTTPGMTLALKSDPTFTVPYNGAQVPTAYQAVIHNTGPTADTYNLTFPTVPAGFTVLDSGTSVTIPAGAMGIVGVYLEPSGTLPAPSTPESFSVTATSASSPAITQTAIVDFDMPTIAAVTVTDDPASLSSTPGVAVTTTLTITNVGNVAFDNAISPTLPSGWTISGEDVPVSLAIGASTTETVTITPPADAALNSTQNVSLTYGPAVSQNTVAVVGVTPTPSSVEAGTPVDVQASILAGMTSDEEGSVGYTLTSSQNVVVFTSTPVAIDLPQVTGLNTVDLGSLTTTGLAPGQYTINATVYDSGGNPIAGATGEGILLIHAPITASQSLQVVGGLPGATDTLAPGAGTVTNTLNIAAQSQLSLTSTDSTAASVVPSGQYTYVIGAADITIVNVSNPASPTVVGTFGSGTLNTGATNLGALAGSDLVVASGTANGTFTFLVYSLANPASPTLLSNTTINYQFPGSMFVQGTTAYVTTNGFDYSGAGPSTITDQFGDFLAIDFSNPASPALVGSLDNSLGTPDGGSTNVNGAAAVTGQLAYVVGSTSSGSDTQTGSGQLLVVNIATPASPTVTDTLTVPNSVQAIAVAIQGSQALVIGTTGGWESPVDDPSQFQFTGNITLTLLDISNPASPTVLSSMIVTGVTPSLITQGTLNIIALGGNQFAISDVQSNGSPAVLLVDASNPASLGVTEFTGAGAVSGMATNGGLLYAATAAGLEVYQAGSITNLPVTVAVQVPTTTGVSIVAGSFNVTPTSDTTNGGVETLVWDFSSLASIPAGGITWQTDVANIAAGQNLAVTLGTTVAYTALGSTTTVTLLPLNVAVVPEMQTLVIPVTVAAPGAVALGSAAIAAAEVGNTILSNQLNDLALAITSLVENPTSAVYLSEVQASIASLVTLTATDPFLAPFAPALTTAAAALAAATTSSDIDTAVNNLGTALDALAQAIVDEGAHGFTISLEDSVAEAEPGSPNVFTIELRNTGTQTTTYDFGITGLPANVTAQFSQPSITLAPGAAIPNGPTIVTVTLSAEAGTSLSPYSFTVTATAEGAAEITNGATGQVVLRTQSLSVASVIASPPFTGSGNGVVWGPIYDPTSQEYIEVVSPGSWSFAESEAQALGGNLITIQDATENAFIVNNVLQDFTSSGGPNLSDVPMWIGLYDPDIGDSPGAQHAADFEWVDGSSSTYRNWNTATNEPNDAPPGEYYTTINWHYAQGGAQGTWNDTPLNGTSGFGGNTNGPYFGIVEVPAAAAAAPVDVTAKIQSVVNEPQQVSVSYTVTDADGNVLYTDPSPTSVSLGITSNLTTVDLGTFAVAGFANGTDTINVTVTDESSSPLPSATDQTTLTIGSPVSASLSVTPPTLPEGSDEVVTNTAQVSAANLTLPAPLTVDGGVTTTPATTVALYNDTADSLQLAYVCGPNGIDVVNVTDPANPVDLGTFGSTDIVSGGLTVGRVDTINGTPYLIVGSTTQQSTGSPAPFTLLVYSLSSALSPSLISTTQFNYGFLSDMVVSGTTVLVPVASYGFLGNVFDGQGGNVMAIDVSNPAAPVLGSVLFGTNDPDGGTIQQGVTIVNGQIAYISSTTTNGGDTQNGVGRVVIVNYSNPDDIQDLGEVDIPGTYEVVDVAIQGNTALVVGRTGGTNGPYLQGTMTLSLLDITNPASPTVIGTTLVTAGQFPTTGIDKISAIPLGGGLFAVSEALVGGNPELMVVDPSNPSAIAVSYISVPALVDEMAVSGSLLYTASADGLTIYNIGTVVSIPVTISVEVPSTTGVSIVANSYNTPPAQIITSTTYDTLVWNQVLAYGNSEVDFTWESELSNLSVGQVLPVTLGATVNFTSNSAPGSFSIPGAAVTGLPVVALFPASNSAQPGATATYDVQLTNPTSSAENYYVNTYDVSDDLSFNFNSGTRSVTIGAGQTLDFPLQVTSSTTDQGNLQFLVQVSTPYATAPVDGILDVSGNPVPMATPNAYGVVAALTPTQATAGQGDTAQYVVQVTNTGSTEEEYQLQVSGLPGGVNYSFNQYQVNVPPGASNFLDDGLQISVGTGIAPNTYPFTVVVSATDGTSSTTVDGTLIVTAEGVNLVFRPSSGSPNSTFDLYVYNTGTVDDTYSLTVGGPAAVAATLSASSVAVPAGQFRIVPITEGAIDFANSGSLQLMATASSQTNTAVVGEATANVVIPSTNGLATSFSPPSATLSRPSSQAFTMLVNNLGNNQDSYTATITGTTGGISASLIDLDGQSTQSIPIFLLPGLSTGALQLNTIMTGGGQGTVTVTITDAFGLVSSSTATVTVPQNQSLPTLIVTDNGGVYTGSAYAASDTVNGGASLDSVTPTLMYYSGTAATGTALLGAPSVVGTYTVLASFSGSTDYTSAAASTTFSITPATPTVNVTDNGGGYTGSTYPASDTVNGGPSLESVSPSLTYYSGTVASGSALSGAPSTAGTYTVLASFNGSANYTSASATRSFTITKATPTVTVTDNGGTYTGSPYPATDTVNGGPSLEDVTPLLTYYSGTAATGTPLGGAPSANGTYTVLASFSGSTDYSSASAHTTFTIGGKGVPTLIVTDAGGDYTGTAYAATDTVNGGNSLEGVTPTLTYYSGTKASGTALKSVPSTVGTYTVRASFAGSTDYTSAAASATFSISKAAPQLAVTDSSGVYTGHAFTASDTVTGVTGVPGNNLEGVTPELTYYSGATASGKALSGAPSAVGTYIVVASFAGSTDYTSASASTTFTISKGAKSTPTLTVTDHGGAYTGSAYPATVQVDGKSNLEGVTPTVTYYSGTQASGTPLSGAPSAVGTYTAVASFAGSTDYTSAIASTTFSIGKASTCTTLSGRPNPAQFGQSVTLTAVVTGLGGVKGTPTGQVVFVVNGNVNLGSVTLSVVGGIDEATLSTKALPAGVDHVIATYNGDGNFAGSSSSSYCLTVSQCDTRTAFAVTPSVTGQTVTLTATTSSSAGTPDGSVTFYDGNSILGTVAGTNGTFTLTSALASGKHSLTAEYFGDASFSGSVSTTLLETISTKGIAPAVVDAVPWQNSANPLDVVGQGGPIVPLDALEIIDYLNTNPGGTALAAGHPGGAPYYDVLGTNSVVPLDALEVINYLNANAASPAAPQAAAVTPAVTGLSTVGNSATAVPTGSNSRVPAPDSPPAADATNGALAANVAAVSPASTQPVAVPLATAGQSTGPALMALSGSTGSNSSRSAASGDANPSLPATTADDDASTDGGNIRLTAGTIAPEPTPSEPTDLQSQSLQAAFADAASCWWLD